MTYQANSKESTGRNDYASDRTAASGAFTSRKYSNLPMSTESLVELKSNCSNGYPKRKKAKGHRHNHSKSPLPEHSSQNHSSKQTHQSNKENVKVLDR